MERATLARPYAEAVGKLAAENKAWDIWSQRLALISLIASDARVSALASDPAQTAERVADLILAVGGAELGAAGSNLVRLLVENKRLNLLPEISALYEALRAEEENELVAHITSAYALSEQQVAGLIGKLETRFGRKVTVTQSVDSELIGGVVIQVGDEVMDSSVRGGLASLAVTLKA